MPYKRSKLPVVRGFDPGNLPPIRIEDPGKDIMSCAQALLLYLRFFSEPFGSQRGRRGGSIQLVLDEKRESTGGNERPLLRDPGHPVMFPLGKTAPTTADIEIATRAIRITSMRWSDFFLITPMLLSQNHKGDPPTQRQPLRTFSGLPVKRSSH